MSTTNDEYRDEIHKVIGNVIRVAGELGVLMNTIELKEKDLWKIMHEIEKFMKKSLEGE